MQLNLLPTIQQAIASLLLTHEPEFLRLGFRLFTSLATVLIAWQGIQMMFSRDGLGEAMFDFAKLLLFVSFGYAMIAFYESPIPGIGVSHTSGERITLFAGAHRGFAPPRTEDVISNTGGVIDLDPELSWNYEAGFRSWVEPLGRRLEQRTTLYGAAATRSSAAATQLRMPAAGLPPAAE